jgi:hypothetical protein
MACMGEIGCKSAIDLAKLPKTTVTESAANFLQWLHPFPIDRETLAT